MSITVKAPSTFSRNGGDSFLAGLDSTGRMYVHGGTGSGSAITPSVRNLERYDPATDTWTTLAASLQYQRLVSWIIDSSDQIIYTTGLVDFPSTFTGGTSRGEIYDPIGNAWSAIPVIPVAGGAGRRGAMFWKDSLGRLNMLGGTAGTSLTYQDGGTSTPPEDGWIYSGGASGTWTQTLPTGWRLAGSNTDPMGPRAAPTSTTAVDPSGRPWRIGGGLNLFGGGGGGNFVQSYDPVGAAINLTALTLTPQTGWAGGYEAATFDAVGNLYIAGGMDLNVAQKTFWKFDPVATTLTRLADMPRAAVGGQLVYVGGLFYHLGGANLTSPLTQIVQYDPTSNVWVDTADVLSVARAGMAVVPSFDGTGYWLYSGNSSGLGLGGVAVFGADQLGWTNTLEFWIPSVIGRAGIVVGGVGAGPSTTQPDQSRLVRGSVGMSALMTRRLRGRSYGYVIG